MITSNTGRSAALRARGRSGPAAALRLLAEALVPIAISASPLSACSVPVFRYALERWAPDHYEAILFHRGPLTRAEQAVTDSIRKNASPLANLKLRSVDMNGELTEELRTLWETQREAHLPWLIVRYPRRRGGEDVIWAGRLSPGAAKALLDSPARREIARRILNGESAVWVLLEGEDKRENDATAEVLKSQLKQIEETLRLPNADGDPAALATDTDIGPELRIGFSLIRVSRSDSAERMLVSMLVHSESDLEQSDEPMVFPVFGRGRVLYALVGKGINAENIKEACAFLVGPCSCQAKAENPGTDLVMFADWQSALKECMVKEIELPRLLGFAGFEAPKPRQAIPATDEQETVGNLTRNVIIVLALGLLAAAIGTLVVFRRDRGTS